MIVTSQITYSQKFLDAYQILPSTIQRKLIRQVQMLSNNARHPSLRVKKMTDMKGIFEARVDHQYRFTFEIKGDHLLLRRIGTHEIYQHP